MPHARPVRRRLFSAVATVFAVTVGASALTAPAAEGATTGTTSGTTTADATATQDVISFPRGDEIFGATSSGFLTLGDTASDRRWVPADGSAPKELSSRFPLQGTGSGDLMGMQVGDDAKLVDISNGQQLTSVFLGPRESLRQYVGAAGQALFTTSDNAIGGKDLHMHTQGVGQEPVTDLPAGATGMTVRAGTAHHGLLTYSTGTGTGTK
ncbi:hypothetical protein ACFW2Y_03385 [Streptomyces sp. NPDC058877]|uniref:hypothetical protein n=1 Tax=unclassified Streptomyces TaxID=2593676 RepID=UPI003692B053